MSLDSDGPSLMIRTTTMTTCARKDGVSDEVLVDVDASLVESRLPPSLWCIWMAISTRARQMSAFRERLHDGSARWR
jgi:hypothetical protein